MVYEIRFFPLAVEGQTVLLLASGRQKSYVLCYEVSQSSDSIAGQKNINVKRQFYRAGLLFLSFLQFEIVDVRCQRPSPKAPRVEMIKIWRAMDGY